MSDFDGGTGEVYTNGHRATVAATTAHVQMQRERMGIGDNLLHNAVWMALKDLPPWITTESQGNRGKYASLKDILVKVRPLLAAQQVRIRQGSEMSRTADEGGGVKGRLVPVYTDLIHVPSGQVERTIVEIPLPKLDPQAMGSAITYGKRYSLIAACGLATDEADDDGAKAQATDITTPAKASVDFDSIKAEIEAAKDIAALTKFISDSKTRKRIESLSEGEQERLRIAYADTREKLNKD